jgi:hypothetical protein
MVPPDNPVKDENMLKMMMMFETTMISATRVDHAWSVTIADSMSGTSQCGLMSDGEFASVMALAIGGDETTGASVLYPVAEKAMANFPVELRIIP